MGKLKDIWLQEQEDEVGSKVAKALGISYLDLYYLKYELNAIETEDGLVTGYYVQLFGDSPKEILAKIRNLKNNTVHLEKSDIETEEDEYYESQYDAIIGNTNFYSNFFSEIQNLERLNKLKVVDVELEQILNRQIFVGVIGTMEVFLSDTFINMTIAEKESLVRFVESHPEFRQRKFELKDVFSAYDGIYQTSKRVMLDTIYHDIPKVREMYKSTFLIEFPDISVVMKHIATRHDLVHRNGKTKEGEKIKIDSHAVNTVINDVKMLVEDIATKLKLINNLPF